jgi:hypothetical protein
MMETESISETSVSFCKATHGAKSQKTGIFTPKPECKILLLYLVSLLHARWHTTADLLVRPLVGQNHERVGDGKNAAATGFPTTSHNSRLYETLLYYMKRFYRSVNYEISFSK